MKALQPYGTFMSVLFSTATFIPTVQCQQDDTEVLFGSLCESPNAHGETVSWGGVTYRYHCGHRFHFPASVPQVYNIRQPSECAASCQETEGCIGFMWMHRGSFCYLDVSSKSDIYATETSKDLLYMERLSGADGSDGPGGSGENGSSNCDEYCLEKIPECGDAAAQCDLRNEECEKSTNKCREDAQAAKEACDRVEQLYQTERFDWETLERQHKKCSADKAIEAQRAEVLAQDRERKADEIARLRDELEVQRNEVKQCKLDLSGVVAECPSRKDQAVVEQSRKYMVACGKWLGAAAYKKGPKGANLQDCLEKCASKTDCHAATYYKSVGMCFFSKERAQPTTQDINAETVWET
ncbi:hypothetical protein BDV25DRAFT_144368 [Aspergillus avenaceus]|uniref:Apple domain-containing protein n=1 Tax=Aspergillus avenaceus TaxID=36643 RepID=A0A5N6THE8_ASPAV|nr:hypothetical protein BDV25DRAFT_144368 [Aspergillus avenaceus]